MRLVDDDQVVVAPVDPVQRHAERFAAVAQQISVAEHVVAETVLDQRVVLQVPFVGDPVVGQLLRAQDQHGSIAQLVVLDDRQGGERLAEADAVGQDATVVGLQLVDDAGRRVPLEVVELLPDDAVLVAGALVWKNILADVFEELAEDAEQHQEVNALRGVLLVDRSDMVADQIRYVRDLVGVFPNLIEELNVDLRVDGSSIRLTKFETAFPCW